VARYLSIGVRPVADERGMVAIRVLSWLAPLRSAAIAGWLAPLRSAAIA